MQAYDVMHKFLRLVNYLSYMTLQNTLQSDYLQETSPDGRATSTISTVNFDCQPSVIVNQSEQRIMTNRLSKTVCHAALQGTTSASSKALKVGLEQVQNLAHQR